MELAPLGCFNIHTSLLPKYRGASPIHYALLNGDKNTGVSIQKMAIQMDAGPVASSIEISIEANDTFSTLLEKLSTASVKAIDIFVNDISENNLRLIEQDPSQVSYAPTIKKEQAYIDPKVLTYSKLNNMMKAFELWPPVKVSLQDIDLKIIQIETSLCKLSPGEFSTNNGELHLCLQDHSVRFKVIQPPGKKPMEDKSFLRGLQHEKK